MFFTFQSCTAVVADERSLRSVYREVSLDGFPIVEDRVALRTSIERRSIQSCRQRWLQTRAPPPRHRHSRDRITSLFLLFGFLGDLQKLNERWWGVWRQLVVKVWHCHYLRLLLLRCLNRWGVVIHHVLLLIISLSDVDELSGVFVHLLERECGWSREPGQVFI